MSTVPEAMPPGRSRPPPYHPGPAFLGDCPAPFRRRCRLGRRGGSRRVVGPCSDNRGDYSNRTDQGNTVNPIGSGILAILLILVSGVSRQPRMPTPTGPG